MWEAVYAALSPVLGPGGVVALYKRTLHLARADHPWLAAPYESTVPPGDFSALRAALAEQSSAVAGAAHDSMLQTLHQLLDTLIGPSLTARLLQAVWPLTPEAGHAVKDNLK